MLQEMNWPAPADCDVRDPERLCEFQNCLKRCKVILASPDGNSIEQQLTELAWQDVVYRSFNEGLRLNRKRKVPHPVPASLVELIHDRYFWSQGILLRRLFEARAARPNKEVYSLPTVVAHVEACLESFVREAYVSYDGIPYESDDERHNPRTRMICAGRHSVFDTFNSVQRSVRDRDDRIAPVILSKLKLGSKLPTRLEYYIGKYAAHASDPGNRAPPDDAPPLLTLGYLERLHKVAIWVTLSLGKLVDQLVLTEVPTPQFDQFDAWEDSLFYSSTKKHLFRYWRKRVDRFHAWQQKYWSTRSFYISTVKVLEN